MYTYIYIHICIYIQMYIFNQRRLPRAPLCLVEFLDSVYWMPTVPAHGGRGALSPRRTRFWIKYVAQAAGETTYGYLSNPMLWLCCHGTWLRTVSAVSDKHFVGLAYWCIDPRLVLHLPVACVGASAEKPSKSAHKSDSTSIRTHVQKHITVCNTNCPH